MVDAAFFRVQMFIFSTLALVLIGTALLGAAAGAFGALVNALYRNLDVDVLAHCTLPGIVVGVLVSGALGLLTGPQATLGFGLAAGALILLCALGGLAGASWLLQALSQRIKSALDLDPSAAQATVLGLGFGLTSVVLGIMQSLPGASQAGLDRLLIGNAALLTQGDVAVIAALSLAVLVALVVFRRSLWAWSFDAGFHRLVGGDTRRVQWLFSVLIFVLTLVGVQVVGAVLLIALVTLPSLMLAPLTRASMFASQLAGGVLGAIGAGLGVWFSAGQLAQHFTQAPQAAQFGLPTGPTIVLTLLMMFFALRLAIALWRVLRLRGQRQAAMT